MEVGFKPRNINYCYSYWLYQGHIQGEAQGGSFNPSDRRKKELTMNITGQSVPIPRHSQTCAKNAGLVTLET